MSVNFGTGKLPFTCWTRGPGIGNWASECFVTFGAGKWLSSCVHLVCFSILLGLLMPCHIRCRQMGFLMCFQNTSDFECLVTYSAAKWLSSCVHPVCFVKTPRVLNALSHLVQTNSFPPVFSQCVFSKHLGFECLVTCSAGKWHSTCAHLYSVFFQYLLDY